MRNWQRVAFVLVGMRTLAIAAGALLAGLGCQPAGPARAAPAARPKVEAPPAPTAPPALIGSTAAGPQPPPLPDLTEFGVRPSPSGPLVITGYPHDVRNGMNDPAQWVGWSKDGELFGYCQQGSGRSDKDTACTFQRRDGAYDHRTSDNGRDEPDLRKVKEIEDWLRDNGIAALRESGASALPPAVRGVWEFPDITLAVARIAASERGQVTAPALVKVGGSVEGESPVYPVTLSAAVRDADGKPLEGVSPHFAVMNGMSLSPDGREIGMVAHFFACEWCDFWEIKRMTVGALASLVYNDLGFRHHQRAEWARAAALFARATAADPTAKLPPYNLACALARQSDPLAEKALRLAIERGGSDVKARAQADPDFAGVRQASWYLALVRP